MWQSTQRVVRRCMQLPEVHSVNIPSADRSPHLVHDALLWLLHQGLEQLSLERSLMRQRAKDEVCNHRNQALLPQPQQPPSGSRLSNEQLPLLPPAAATAATHTLTWGLASFHSVGSPCVSACGCVCRGARCTTRV
jgi:hypothetical protein